MKKQLMLMVALMMGVVVFAQQKDARHGKGTYDKMKSELSLSDAQDATIKSIAEKYAGRHASLRQDSTKTREQKFDAMKSLREEKDKEIKAVLTAEQQKKWQTYNEQRREKGKVEMQKASERYEQKMKSELSLTDDQFTKVQAENKLFHAKLAQLHQTGTHSDADRKAAYGKAKSDHDAALKSILTDDQYKKWIAHQDKMKQAHHDHKRKG